MKFKDQLIAGNIIKRYKRFLADITLESGETITAHVANTGSMKSCWAPSQKVLVSYHDAPKRKLKYSLEMVNNGKTWIGINTSIPNKLVAQAIAAGEISQLRNYPSITPEYKIGKSRLDLLLENDQEKCFVEIKNVTLVENNIALFPDAITTRGQKHLQELMALKEKGHRAVMFYLVQREDADLFAPAKEIDPGYSSMLKSAQQKGVEILVYQCALTPDEIRIKRELPYQL